MRFPASRREQYREPFPLTAAVITAALMALLVLAFILAQRLSAAG